MFRQHNNEYYWNDKPVVGSTSGLKVQASVFHGRPSPLADILARWECKHGNDPESCELCDAVIVASTGSPIFIPPDIYDLDKLDKKIDKIAAQTNHNFRILDNRSKEIKGEVERRFDDAAVQDWVDFTALNAKISSLNEELVNGRRLQVEHKHLIKELQKEVMILKEKKMDRPSLSTDLINAERYIDDIYELERKLAEEKDDRRKRIQEKLESIKKANTLSKTTIENNEDDDGIGNFTASVFIGLCIVIAIFIGTGLGTLINGVL